MEIPIRIEPITLRSVLAFATLTSAASAEPPRASLVVTRDDGSRDCPDAAGFAERVRLIAGTSMVDAATSEARDTWIQVELMRAFGGYRAVISLQGRRHGKRIIDDVGPGCSSLADAIAITLVMLLDPELERAPEQPPAAPEFAAAPPVPKSAPRKNAEPVTQQAAQPPHWVAGAEVAAGLSFSVLEGSAPFAEGGARLQFERWISFGAGGGFVFSDRARFGSGSIELELGYVYLRACAAALSSPRARVEFCLEPMLGSLTGAGNEYTEIHTKNVLWPAAAGVIAVYGPFAAHAFWSLRVLALAPLVKNQGFSIIEAGVRKPAFELPAAGGMLSVGVRADL